VIFTQDNRKEFKGSYSKSSLIRSELTRMSDNPVGNMKNEKLCSQLNTYFKRHMAFGKANKSLFYSDTTL
jgi:hypothetical protein